MALAALLLYHVAVVHAGKRGEEQSQKRIQKEYIKIAATRHLATKHRAAHRAMVKKQKAGLKQKQDAFRAHKEKQLSKLNSMNTKNAKNAEVAKFAHLGYPQGVRGE